MARPTRSSTVPKAMESVFGQITASIDAFCAEHLDQEYASLARDMTSALARKRPSPLAGGKPQTWACGIVYMVGRINFLFDKSNSPHLTAAQLCAGFGVGQSTASAKVKVIDGMLKTVLFDPRWLRVAMMAHNPLIWLIEVDGFVIDVRQERREVQAAAYAKGLIPYIPADRD